MHTHKRTCTTHTHTDLRTKRAVRRSDSTFDGCAAEARVAKGQHRVLTKTRTQIWQRAHYAKHSSHAMEPKTNSSPKGWSNTKQKGLQHSGRSSNTCFWIDFSAWRSYLNAGTHIQQPAHHHANHATWHPQPVSSSQKIQSFKKKFFFIKHETRI